MEKPTNNGAAAASFSSFSTHGHEAEHAADDSSLSSSEDGIERHKEGRIFSVRLEDMAQWSGQPVIKGSRESMRMALLTFSIIGIQ